MLMSDAHFYVRKRKCRSGPAFLSFFMAGKHPIEKKYFFFILLLVVDVACVVGRRQQPIVPTWCSLVFALFLCEKEIWPKIQFHQRFR